MAPAQLRSFSRLRFRGMMGRNQLFD